MADDLTLPVKVTGAREGARDFDLVARAIDGVGDKTTGTVRELSTLSRTFDRAGDKAATLGRRSAAAAEAINEAGVQSRQTARQLDDMGDEADQAARKVGRLGRQLRLTAVEGTAEGFMGQLGQIGSAIGGAGRAGLIAGIAANIPNAALATLSLTLTAVGAAGLAGGLILAAKDPKVHKAFGGLRDKLMDIDTTDMVDAVTRAQAAVAQAQDRLNGASGLKSRAAAKKDLADAKKELADAQAKLNAATAFNKQNVSLKDLAQPFVDPLARVADRLGLAFDRLKPTIEKVFSTLAPTIDQLADGLAGLFEHMAPGFLKATEAAKPLLEVLAAHLPKIGDSMSQFFAILAEHSDQAKVGLALILTTIEVMLPAIARVLGFFGDTFDFAAGLITGFKNTVFGAINAIIDALNRLPGVDLPHVGSDEKGKGKSSGRSGLAGVAPPRSGSGARALAAGGTFAPGETVITGEAGYPERVTAFAGGGGVVTPMGPSASSGGDILGFLEVRHVGPSGEHIRTELVKLRRQKRYSTFDKMVPA